MTPKQEDALLDYLQEVITPLIEQVLVKKLGQAVSFAKEELIQPKREWVGLTNDEVNNFAAGCHLGNSVQGAIYKAEARLKEKNNDS
jgi:hypothetical protein